MGTGSDRVLFLGTEDGLYRATGQHGDYRVDLVGLKGMSFIRFPLAVDRTDPRRMFVGSTRGGVYRSDDGGQSWQPCNEGIVHRDIWCVVQHPARNLLYAGSSPAGVYESSDGGENWRELESLGQLRTTREWTGPVPPHVSRMKCLDLTPADPNLIFGAIEEGWAVCSRDAGATWEQIDGIDHDGHMIAVMADDPSIVVSTTGKGIFRSTDAGRTWQPSEGLEEHKYTPAHLVRDPREPGFLMTVATRLGPGGFRRADGAGAAFVRSHNQGAHWEVVDSALPADFVSVPRSLAADPEAPGTYFAGMLDGSVWLSEDYGDTFRPALKSLPQVTSITVTHQ
jgi:photosystem II stability/assembly factor-like uncharacterized protein